ncbi:hypothetical protein M427DRAFT_56717 [Gonapodya prolifera JEL478]|uniref:RING-type E3 ubiquitin transferase n=1 Tax=Gonapodya prolifera (strain JEL478) TaxID=1344416 RepID=A0A139AF26_GONPJ|nr:hypothetical protein M427DRAFT_56717 [Gonapodya prolifera JEL478]|eukprot:KXS15358.1 hypothetical protein M427DRAFT_56717 [Gonapodya prolifera JEL478]
MLMVFAGVVAVLTAVTVAVILHQHYRRRRLLAPLRHQNPEIFREAVAQVDDPETDGDGDLRDPELGPPQTLDPLILQTLKVWRFEGRKSKKSSGGVAGPDKLQTASDSVGKAPSSGKEPSFASPLPVSSSSETLHVEAGSSPDPRALTESQPPAAPVLTPPPKAQLAVPRGPRRSSTGTIPDPSSEYCPICLDAFTRGASLRSLPCGHTFHVTCVDQWLVHQRGECPLCRLDLTRRGTWWRTSYHESASNPTTVAAGAPSVTGRESPNGYHIMTLRGSLAFLSSSLQRHAT